ncbi:MAG: hypothetical protein HYU39_09375 [Thaumarchaeota archaeon]|nr:hypothetical protein [Nitrososphaerota archaeon]
MRLLDGRFVDGFKANRELPPSVYGLGQVFVGLEKSPAIAGIFGRREVSSGVLGKVIVEIGVDRPRYMRVSDDDGRILVGRPHLLTGDDLTLYLDAVHELTHVRQFWEGKALYDKRFEYVDRPTEVEAFRNATNEALRLGLGVSAIRDYLKTDWMTVEDLEKLIKNMAIRLKAQGNSED